MASTSGVSSSPIPEVLNRNNYKTWRSRIETYLLAEDLWEVIETIREPAANKARKKKNANANAKALYAIQNSCGQEMFQFISQTKEAKFAWEILEKASKLRGPVENSAEYFEPYVQFTKFVREGDWDKAKKCLKLKDLDLHSAVKAIDPRDELGDTAIHVAARHGYMHILKELMRLLTHEDLKMVNARRDTALHVAAANGQLETAKELVLLMGEERNNDGDTALHLAVQWEEVDVVEVLVSLMRQTDLKIKNNNGFTALHLAVKKRNVAMIKYLAALIGEVRGPDGDTALHLAVKLEAAKVVKELVVLMKEEDLAIKNDEGYTALHLAVKEGIVAVVKEFMTKEKERDFDSNIQFATYLIKGEWDNAKECLTELDDLCDAIMTVVPRDGYGDTALHGVARQGHVHIVKELISLLKERQVIPESQTIEDITTFGSAINLGVTEEVVRKRAKYIVEQYEKLLTGILEVQNTKGSTALHIAASNGNLDIVKELVPLTRKEGLEIQDDEGFTPLLIAVGNDDIDIVKELLPVMRQGGLELKTAEDGYNALHLAVRNGHMNIAKEVMPFMRKEALEEKDGEGNTALGCALAGSKDEDVMEIAKYMAENNDKVFGVDVSPNNWIPVVEAGVGRKWDLCRYLYPLTPLEYLTSDKYKEHGAQLIITCFRAQQLDMALDLLRRCSKLDIVITPAGDDDGPPVMELARMRSAFLSGSQLGFWQRLIYNRLHIEPANLSTLYTCINIPQQEDNRDNQTDLIHSVTTLYKKLVHRLFTLLGVIQLREMKWIHTRSIDILRCISEMLKKEPPTSAQLDVVRKSMFKAVEHGNVEFVTHICEAHPSLAKSRDEESKNIFQFAVECRQHKIYSLVYKISEEDQRSMGLHVIKYPENILHLAGKLSPLSRFNRIRGTALQMQRELQWFKEVENIVPLDMREVANSDGMTPHELFTKNHETLKKEAEDSMKGTATSCTVVGALIVTMMFAAAFTVPGGNNGSTGAPMFLTKKLFLVFIISDTLSLVSSTTSVIIFLGILTSRYAEDDFLKNLPTKMMTGLSTLFISIVTMMIAFSSALTIMLDKEYSWAVIPSIFAASIPVASFIWLQFPLLIEIIWSTYGPGIFDKKLKKGKTWIKL